jgi:hypothetical protein
MPEMIGPVTIPEPGTAGVFPVTLDYSSVEVREPRVAVHRFGTLDAKVEQRFFDGPGAHRFQVQLARLTPARRAAVADFFEARRGSFQPFTLQIAEPDGTIASYTARFAEPTLSLDASADGSWRGAVDLVEVPTSTPTCVITSTETRFPGSSLKAALLSQTQEMIPLIRIAVAEHTLYLSDRRVTVGGNLHQPRLMSWGGISQTMGEEADQASFVFGNGDRVCTSLVNQVDLYKAEIEFSAFHVGTGVKLDIWKGFIGSWSFDGGPEFRIEAHDGLYALRLGYPARKIVRQDEDPRRAFAIPNQPVNVGGKKGISRITSVSVANDTAYGRPVKDIWVNSATALPVECDVIAGRDESEFYAALGVVGRGPLGGYGAGHTLDGQPHHGPGSLGLRRAYGGTPATGDETAANLQPDQGSDSFALDAVGAPLPANPLDGVAFLQIRRTDEKSIQAVRAEERRMTTYVTAGLGGWTWSGTGPYTRAWQASLTNPIWIAVNTYLNGLGLLWAAAAEQQARFDVGAAIAAAAICDAYVDPVIGTGTERQFTFQGIIGEEKPLRDWIQEILSSCLGYATLAFGKLKVGIRSNSSTVEAFTAGNILFNSLQLSSRSPRFNDLTVAFSDVDYGYQQNTVNLKDSDHAASTGTPLKANVNLLGVTSKSQAARITTVKLREELGGLTQAEQRVARRVEFRTTILALNVEPGMVCSMTAADMPGGTGEFRVTSWRLNPDWSIDVAGETTCDSMYDLTVGDKPIDVTPDPLPERQTYPVDVGGTVGQNLLRNMGFERGLTNWHGSIPTPAITIIQTDPDTGMSCIRIAATGATEIHQPTGFADGESDVLPCDEGEAFLFRGRYRFDAGSTVDAAQARIAFYDATGGYIDAGATDLDPAKTDWDDFLLSATAPAGAKYMGIFPWFGELLSGAVYLDTLVAERSVSLNEPAIGEVSEISATAAISVDEGVVIDVAAACPTDENFAGCEVFAELPKAADPDPAHPTLPGQLSYKGWWFAESGGTLAGSVTLPLPPVEYLQNLPDGQLRVVIYFLSRAYGYANRFTRLTSVDPMAPQGHTAAFSLTLDFTNLLLELADPLGDVTVLETLVGPAPNGGVTIEAAYKPPNVGGLSPNIGSFKGVAGHTALDGSLMKSHGDFIYEGNQDPTATDAIGHAALVIEKPETLPAKVVIQLPSFDTETRRMPQRIGWSEGDPFGVPSGWGAVVTVTEEALAFSAPVVAGVVVETKNVPGEGWKYRLAVTLAGTFANHPNYEAAKVFYRDPEDPLPAAPEGWLNLRQVAFHMKGDPSLTVFSDWHPIIAGTNVAAHLRAVAYETGGDNPLWSAVYGPVTITLPKDDARGDAGHAHNFSVTLDGYHSDGNGVVYARLNVSFSPLSGSRYVYGIWEYRGETLPPSPSLWTATDANFIASPGTMWVPVPEDEPVTIWYALVVSDRDGGVWLTPADYVSDPLATASVTIQPRGPSDQVSNFSVTVGRDEAQDVPQGWFIFQFDVPADPDFFCVDFFRRPADQNGTPIGDWGVHPVCSLQAPGRQDGSWAIPAEEHWIFKAVAVNDLGERNEVDPPTCFVTITASVSGVKAGRLDPGAVDRPLTVDFFGRATVGLNAILSDHIETLAVTKLIGLIQSSQIASILASKISGTISSDQIGSIAASKIAGTIQSSQIESVAASKITGTLQASQISSVAATQISGSIQANQIASLAASQITGVIVTNQLADSILNTARLLGANLALPVYVASLPTLPNANYPIGTLVLRTSDKTLWENVAGAWTAKTASESLTGKIAAADIVSVNASTFVGLITAAQIQSIAATQITGSISSDQIASIAATKISGSISSNQIDSIAASKISGSITSTQIESVAATKITGSISSDQIASIAASKITGTISANQIGSINATSITGTIIANQIGAVNANVVVISQSVPFSNIWTSGSMTAVGSIYSDTGNVVASNGTLRGAGLHITGGGIYIDSPSSFRSAIGAAASPVAWAEVTGKPSVFPPDVHSHSYAPASHTHSVQVGLGMNKTWIQDLNSNWYEVVSDVWVSSVTVT